MKAEESFADVAGGKLHFTDTGDGFPIFFLHGGLLDLTSWDEQVPAFAERYRVIRYDLRGYGQSESSAQSFSHADDLKSLLDYFGISEAVLVGNSLGSRVSIEFAADAPDRVAALILSSPGIGGFEWSEEWTTYESEIGEALGRGNIQEAMNSVLRLTLGPRRSAEAVDPALVGRVERATMNNWMKRASSPLGKWDERPTRDRLKSVRSPALVLIGDEDFQDIIMIGDVLEAELSKVRRVVIPGVAHQINMEAPSVFNKKGLEFLAEINQN